MIKLNNKGYVRKKERHLLGQIQRAGVVSVGDTKYYQVPYDGKHV